MKWKKKIISLDGIRTRYLSIWHSPSKLYKIRARFSIQSILTEIHVVKVDMKPKIPRGLQLIMTIEIIIGLRKGIFGQFIKVENPHSARAQMSHIFDIGYTIALNIEFLDVWVCVASSAGLYWGEQGTKDKCCRPNHLSSGGSDIWASIKRLKQKEKKCLQNITKTSFEEDFIDQLLNFSKILKIAFQHFKNSAALSKFRLKWQSYLSAKKSVR